MPKKCIRENDIFENGVTETSKFFCLLLVYFLIK